jgi:hypothetical protein
MHTIIFHISNIQATTNFCTSEFVPVAYFTILSVSGVEQCHGWLVIQLQWVWSKRSHHNRNIILGGPKKITINISHHNRCPGRSSKRTAPRYRPRALLLHQPARCNWTRNKWYPMYVCTDFCNVTLLCNRNMDVVTAYNAVRNTPRALNFKQFSGLQTSEHVLTWIRLLDSLRWSTRENIKRIHGKSRFISYRVYFLIIRPPMANWAPFFNPC